MDYDKSLFGRTSFNLNAMVNMTKVILELILYPDMYIFFEKGMGGGVSYISNRCSRANNKYLKSYARIKTYYILRRE